MINWNEEFKNFSSWIWIFLQNGTDDFCIF